MGELLPDFAGVGDAPLLTGGTAPGGKALPKRKSVAERKQALMEASGDIEEEISEEALSKKVRREKIGNYVQKNPMETAKLINAWLREDQY